MATQEIQSTDWESFCEKFLRLHQGSTMSVVQIRPSGGKVEVIHEMPLTNISFNHGGCNDSILFNFQEEGTREVTHEVVDPIHVKIREEGQGKKGLQIDGENGSTLISFSSGKIDELLDGIQLQ